MNFNLTQDAADSTQHAAHMLASVRRFCKLRRREVARSTRRIAAVLGPEFAIPADSLQDIERGRVIPTVPGLSSLCAVYGLEMPQMLGWYGIQAHLELAGSEAAA